MAWVKEQSSSVVSVASGDLTISFSSTTAGNLLTVGLTMFNQTPPAAPSGWTKRTADEADATSPIHRTVFYDYINNPGGLTSFTVNVGNYQTNAQFNEWSHPWGADAAVYDDTASAPVTASSVTSSLNIQGGTAAYASELAVAVCSLSYTSSTKATLTAGTGFTQVGVLNNGSKNVMHWATDYDLDAAAVPADNVGCSATGAGSMGGTLACYYVPPPSMPFLSNAEGGSNGVTVTPANSGEGSGTAFDTVYNVGTGTLTQFSTAYSAHGSLSYRLYFPASAAYAGLAWNGSLIAYNPATAWFRMYLRHDGNPSVETRVLDFLKSTGGMCASVRLSTSGNLSFYNASGVLVFTTTSTVPLGAWYRLEGYVTASASGGEVELKLFASPDSSTATETQTSVAYTDVEGVGQARFGSSVSVVQSSPFDLYLDDLGISDSAYLGPVSGGSVAKSDSDAARASEAVSAATAYLSGIEAARASDGGESGIPVTKASTDAARASEAASVTAVTLTSTDAARASEAASVTAVALSGTETARVTEAQAVAATNYLSDYEAARAAESTSLTAALASTEAARASEAAVLAASLSGTEAAGAAEAAAVAAALASAEPVLAAEAGLVTQVTLSAAEAAVAAESAAIGTVYLSVAENAVAAEAGAVLGAAEYKNDTDVARVSEAVSISLASAGSVLAAEAASVTASLAAADAAAVAEAQALTASLAALEGAQAAESAGVTAYPASADVACAAETQLLALAGTEVAQAAETQVSAATLAGAEQAQVTDIGAVLGATQYISSAEPVSASEVAAVLAMLAGTETAQAAETSAVNASLVSADAGLAGEVAVTIAASLASTGSATASETGAVRAVLGDSDRAQAAEGSENVTSVQLDSDAAMVASAGEETIAALADAEAARAIDAGESGTGAPYPVASEDSAAAAEAGSLAASLASEDSAAAAESPPVITAASEDSAAATSAQPLLWRWLT